MASGALRSGDLQSLVYRSAFEGSLGVDDVTDGGPGQMPGHFSTSLLVGRFGGELSHALDLRGLQNSFPGDLGVRIADLDRGEHGHALLEIGSRLRQRCQGGALHERRCRFQGRLGRCLVRNGHRRIGRCELLESGHQRPLPITRRGWLTIVRGHAEMNTVLLGGFEEPENSLFVWKPGWRPAFGISGRRMPREVPLLHWS